MFIARALPQARILHMVRDPVETCFSNLRELFSEANPYSYDQQELAHFHRHYRRLMRHWHKPRGSGPAHRPCRIYAGASRAFASNAPPVCSRRRRQRWIRATSPWLVN